MRILIVSEDVQVLRDLAAALDSPRRTAITADPRRAATEIRTVAPDVLVVHVVGPTELELISTLSALAPSMYVLAVLGTDLPARATAAAIASGSQDVLRVPYSRDELLVRVDARERLCRWMGGAQDKADAGIPAIRAWQYLETVVADDLEGMLGTTVKLVEKRRPTGAAVQLATILMTIPAAQLDLCLSITADAAARKWLGAALLGDEAPTGEVVQDIVRELANLVGGAFKRAALVERLAVSTGIPIDNDPTPCGPNARYWEIEAEGGAVIGLVADVRAKPNRRVPARRLAEGMVVVKDVVNGSGVLLLPSGTRLTSTTAERLSRLLDQTLIDVSA